MHVVTRKRASAEAGKVSTESWEGCCQIHGCSWGVKDLWLQATGKKFNNSKILHAEHEVEEKPSKQGQKQLYPTGVWNAHFSQGTNFSHGYCPGEIQKWLNSEIWNLLFLKFLVSRAAKPCFRKLCMKWIFSNRSGLLWGLSWPHLLVTAHVPTSHRAYLTCQTEGSDAHLCSPTSRHQASSSCTPTPTGCLFYVPTFYVLPQMLLPLAVGVFSAQISAPLLPKFGAGNVPNPSPAAAMPAATLALGDGGGHGLAAHLHSPSLLRQGFWKTKGRTSFCGSISAAKQKELSVVGERKFQKKKISALSLHPKGTDVYSAVYNIGF